MRSSNVNMIDGDATVLLSNCWVTKWIDDSQCNHSFKQLEANPLTQWSVPGPLSSITGKKTNILMVVIIIILIIIIIVATHLFVCYFFCL